MGGMATLEQTPDIKTRPESYFTLLRGEIHDLLKAEQQNRMDLGRLFRHLREERSNHKNGTYIKDLKRLHYSWKRADKLIKFYERELRVILAKNRKKAEWEKLFEKWGIEVVNALDKLFNAQENDKQIATAKL